MHNRCIPMHNRCIDPAYLTSPALKDYLDAAGEPEDVYEAHHFLCRLSPALGDSVYLETLIEEHLAACIGTRRQHKAQEAVRQHLGWVLLNLAFCTVTRQWLVIPMTTNSYSDEYWLRHFSLPALKSIMGYLADHGLVTVNPGKKYTAESKATRYFPVPQLQHQLIPLGLSAEQPLNPPYVTCNEPTPEFAEVFKKLSGSHPEHTELRQINNFLRDHTWACKGPVVLKYKYDFLHSGRLYTRFASLPNNRVPIRLNTLIDGKPICEVDYSANHLRLALAGADGSYAGDTPYEDIAEACGATRQAVKQFITMAMGASNRGTAMRALTVNGITREAFDDLERATCNRFPALRSRLFVGLGINLQSIEGAIMRGIMLQGVRDGIVALPIHDAVAVQQEHEEWAKQTMTAQWLWQVGGPGLMAFPVTRTKYPT
jgi:hypothetical protein